MMITNTRVGGTAAVLVERTTPEEQALALRVSKDLKVTISELMFGEDTIRKIQSNLWQESWVDFY